MISAIKDAWASLQTRAGTGGNYWQDIIQVVEMMETQETRCYNEEEFRNLRKQVLQIVQTTYDDQGRKMFLVQGITDTRNMRRAEVTEWGIKLNARRA